MGGASRRASSRPTSASSRSAASRWASSPRCSAAESRSRSPRRGSGRRTTRRSGCRRTTCSRACSTSRRTAPSTRSARSATPRCRSSGAWITCRGPSSCATSRRSTAATSTTRRPSGSTRPRRSTVCFLEEFQAWHAATYDGATTYDLGAETFDARLSTFRETTAPTNEVNVVASWKELIGFVDGELRFVRVDAKLSVIEEGAMDKKKRRLGQFNDLVDRVERAGGAEFLGDDLFHSSEAWVWYKTQTALVKGLLLGLSLAFPVAF